MKTANTSKPQFAVAALRVDLKSTPLGELRLLPAGYFKARDGRPHELKNGWHIDSEIAARLIHRASLKADDAVIDYEHQTLNSETNGQPAPAAGWFKHTALEWREDGLYALDVSWTAPAKAAIESNEYRYFSPVIEYDPKTGAVLGVAMGALTNYAAIDGLDGLSRIAAAKFDFTSLSNPTENLMDREQLIALLGLAADATDEQITAAINELKTKVDKAANEAEQVAALKTEVAALKAAPTTKPDPSQYVPVAVVEELKTGLAALKAAQVTTKVEALVKAALDDGNLLPAQESWAIELGNSNIAALKTYIEATPAVAALKGTQTRGQAPTNGNDHNFHADEVAVMQQLGVSADDYKKAQEL